MMTVVVNLFRCDYGVADANCEPIPLSTKMSWKNCIVVWTTTERADGERPVRDGDYAAGQTGARLSPTNTK